MNEGFTASEARIPNGSACMKQSFAQRSAMGNVAMSKKLLTGTDETTNWRLSCCQS